MTYHIGKNGGVAWNLYREIEELGFMGMKLSIRHYLETKMKLYWQGFEFINPNSSTPVGHLNKIYKWYTSIRNYEMKVFIEKPSFIYQVKL